MTNKLNNNKMGLADNYGHASSAQEASARFETCRTKPLDLFTDNRSRIVMNTIKIGQSMPMSWHVHASKQITVISGCAELEFIDSNKKIYEGQTHNVPIGTAHIIRNIGKIPLRYVEIRTGTYLKDDETLE